MTPKIEKLKTKIAKLQDDLRIATKELRAVIDEIPTDELVALVTGETMPFVKASTSKPRKPAGERKPRADGLPAKLLAVINASYPDTWTADQLIGNLKIELDKAQQVRTTLSRLLKQSKITSPTSGKYSAKEVK
jgi:hypothetical protein